MPKRVIDFDAMWGSDKLASCAAWAQAEYAWLYGLADASGCFELTNLRVIWGRVAAIRGNFTIERLEQVFAEFQDKGLLFVWEHEGKRYAHWTGSDVPGRLPPPSWRMRLEKLAPPVPKRQLGEYMARFSRGRAALGGMGFRGGADIEASGRKENLRFESSDLRQDTETANLKENLRFESSDWRQGTETANLNENVRFENSKWGDESGGGIKAGLEETQGQDLNLGLDWKLNEKWEVGRGAKPGHPKIDSRERKIDNPAFYNSNSQTDSNATATAKANAPANAEAVTDGNSNATATAKSPNSETSNSNTRPGTERAAWAENARWAAGTAENGHRDFGSRSYASSARDLAVARELRVGQGPVCGPIGIRPEVLERIRQREEARAKAATKPP